MTKRDILKGLAFPGIVGLVIVLAGFLVDQYKTTRRVSAAIEGPFAFAQIHELFDEAQISITIAFGSKKQAESTQETHLNSSAEKPLNPVRRPPSAPSALGMAVQLSDVNDLHVYRVTIKNTGKSPIRDLPIRLVFEKASAKFSLLALKHKTNPAREFGEIKDELSELSSPRFVYQLLNPGDEDVITILAPEKRELKAYSKGEGVSFDVTNANDTRSANWFLAIISSALVGVIFGLLTNFLGRLFKMDLRA